ncbi:MAG: hypothetical protein ACXITV_07120 [Luteibaculaceae bacterium]
MPQSSVLKNVFLPALLALFIAFGVGCAGDANKNKKTKDKELVLDIHENSEMALYMRSMEQVFYQLKDSLEQDGDISNFDLNFEKLFTAQIFDPSKTGPMFDGFAHNFLDLTAKLQAIDEAQERKKAFNIAVEGCMACHKAYCPGPITAIKKLKIEV